MWTQSFQRLAVVPICQQALPLRSAGCCIYGPCNCFSVPISCSKPWHGMFISGTKAAGWISRLRTLEAPFWSYPTRRLLALWSPVKDLQGNERREERMLGVINLALKNTSYRRRFIDPSLPDPQMCWRRSLPLQQSTHS